MLCQLNLVLEDASSSKMAGKLPICFLVWKESTMRLVASECLDADFKFLIGVNRYRKWHAANLRSEKVPLIENQSEAQFRLEANVMVRACNSDSGTVELNAG